MKALLLGDRSALDARVEETFRITGIYHVSGRFRPARRSDGCFPVWALSVVPVSRSSGLGFDGGSDSCCSVPWLKGSRRSSAPQPWPALSFSRCTSIGTAIS